jgi:NAD(P)-dependent dehydrogenase (short-subunit alcohol dehydrogenase family)
MGLPDRMRAVVTGGASGLGRAIAEEIGARGGEVVVADVNAGGAEETVGRVERAGGRAWAFRCDVGDAAEVDALAREAERRMGETDLIVNNAGVAVGGPVDTVPIEDWRWIVDINLWGVIHGCRAFLPRMRERGSGFVLNVASVAGLVSPPGMAPYNVTKAGVVALSETLHADHRKEGIVVTVLCPSFFKTNIVEAGRGADERMKEMARKQMARSRVQAADVARAALRALDRGELYAVPMLDARAFWGLKRATPVGFYRLVGMIMAMMERGG